MTLRGPRTPINTTPLMGGITVARTADVNLVSSAHRSSSSFERCKLPRQNIAANATNET